MTWFKYLLKSNDDDSHLVINRLLEKFGNQFTERQVAKLLASHEEYPSLLAIKDVLSRYGIDSDAVRKGNYAYSDFETPFICLIQQEDWSRPSLSIVLNADEEEICYLDPISSKDKIVSVSEFEQIDKQIVLLLDGDGAVDEENYQENKRVQFLDRIIGKLPLLLGVFPLLWTGVFLLSGNFHFQQLISVAFLISSFVALFVCILLLWHEVDAHNPFLKEVCGGQGKKANCGAVLESKSSTFLGISWSSWGFAYFATFFVCQMFFPGQAFHLMFWSVASIFVAPYILFSIYYQSKIVKQWCPLCVTVQGVLLLNTIMSALVLFHTIKENVLSGSWHDIGLIVFLGVCFLVGSHIAIPLLKQAKDSADYERKWKKLKYNAEIFQSLLEKNERITVSPDDIGIIIGNPKAGREIVKVCNPYCGPCSKVHPILEELIRENNDIRLRIIFTASVDEQDIKTPPVAHLLAIQEKYGQEKVHQAMNDWYLAEKKDYQLFSSKYPMNGELKLQQNKIKVMREWCDAMKIRATPTIYIDGYELPDSYRIYELKHLL
ncbi:thioredoxin domain-containing protein [Olivibacter sp. SDN3]|uniref:vitamin K epoxide reductase family protein n=1 Tax=Olivibacter sp. SDN3 TaxID=2764720 RepID=UPI0016516CCA|nr:vitamin K epoxide reductase family protein [Olivibacter sp. SDN3]QNL49825.1 thioredoxin domain-containing protein [Olivibacter sp. SDN3]